jgi:hypothetical protein
MKRKGEYPYDEVADHNYFNQTSLPPMSSFYSILKRKDISHKKYHKALTIWNEFECRTFGEYSDLYCMQDVINLVDCFEKFRAICLKKENYGLDPCYYVSTPGLTWDCGLKYTKVILENLTDYNMMLFHERGKRGGIAGIMGTRHVKANNKYLKNYDKNKDNIFLEYFDANNLYGLAISQFLPTGGHK